MNPNANTEATAVATASTPLATPTTTAKPDACMADAYLADALRALPVCIAHCSCPDRWHTLWAGIKAVGALRGLHAQTDFLRGLLRPHVGPGAQVLIGGAADTGSLEVLNAVLADPSARYCLADVCPAPLHLVQARATELGLQLQAEHVSLDEVRARQPWDLVFIHYTLSFMDAAARQRMAQHLREDLAPGGVVVCAVRHIQPDPASDNHSRTQALQARVASLGHQLGQTFANEPALREPLLHSLPAYAQARQAREAITPHFDTVAAEFNAAGFELLQCHQNPGDPVRPATDVSAPGTVTTWVAVFAPRRG